MVLYTHTCSRWYMVFFKIKFKQFLNFWANIERNYTFFFRFIIQSKQYLARSLKWMCLTASRDCFVKTIFYTCDARWLVLRSIEVFISRRKTCVPLNTFQCVLFLSTRSGASALTLPCSRRIGLACLRFVSIVTSLCFLQRVDKTFANDQFEQFVKLPVKFNRS